MVETPQDKVAQMVRRTPRRGRRRGGRRRGRRRRGGGRRRRVNLTTFHLSSLSYHSLLLRFQQDLEYYQGELSFFRFLICDIHISISHNTFLLCNNYQFCLISYPFFKAEFSITWTLAKNIFTFKRTAHLYYPTSPAIALTFQIIENTSNEQETDWLDEYTQKFERILQNLHQHRRKCNNKEYRNSFEKK